MSDSDRLLPFDRRRLMDERAVPQRLRLHSSPGRVIAHQQGARDRRQILELEFEQVRGVELPILQGFVEARPLTAEARRARQLRKGGESGRSQHGVNQLKERIARTGQTSIDRLAETRQLAKLRLGSVFVVHTSIALPDSGFGKSLTAVFSEKHKSD